MRPVAILGPGRVGTTLAMGLAHAGYRITGVAGRSRTAVEQFTQRFSDAEEGPAATVTPEAELVVVAVADDDRGPLLDDVVERGGVTRGQRWVHITTEPQLSAVRRLQEAGAHAVAARPAVSFGDDPDKNYAALPGTAWAVAAAQDDMGWASVLITDLRGTPVSAIAGPDPGSTGHMLSLARDVLPGASVPTQRNAADREKALEVLTSVYRNTESLREVGTDADTEPDGVSDTTERVDR